MHVIKLLLLTLPQSLVSRVISWIGKTGFFAAGHAQKTHTIRTCVKMAAQPMVYSLCASFKWLGATIDRLILRIHW